MWTFRSSTLLWQQDIVIAQAPSIFLVLQLLIRNELAALFCNYEINCPIYFFLVNAAGYKSVKLFLQTAHSSLVLQRQLADDFFFFFSFLNYCAFANSFVTDDLPHLASRSRWAVKDEHSWRQCLLQGRGQNALKFESTTTNTSSQDPVIKHSEAWNL